MMGLARLAPRGLCSQTFKSLRQFCASAESEIELEVIPFQTHKIDDPPDNKVTTTKSELLGYFETMYRIRRMEIAADMLYKAKLIRGFCHLYDGQEAVITGIAAGTTYEDSIITSYRDHAAHIVRGGTVKEVMGELLGKTCGAAGGVGGSMHMYKKENNFYGGCGIVGAQIPLGAGLALKHKMLGEKNVALTLYGDGAANQGQLAESINMCALWDVPCIFVCENNHYGMGTADWRGSKAPAFYKRGDYIPGIRVDGMDVLAVKKCTEFAKAYSIENGPMIIEADTYRYHGHSMSDPGSTYRTRDEVSSMRQERDPIERVKKLMLSNDLAEAGELKAIEKRIKNEIDTIIEECKAAPTPDMSRLAKNIYVENLGTKLRGAVSGKWIVAGADAVEPK